MLRCILSSTRFRSEVWWGRDQQYAAVRWGHRAFAVIFAILLPLVSAVSAFATSDDDNRFLTAAQDPAVIANALERERQGHPPSLIVTGISVPHHSLAADLIARGVLAASGSTYDRVLLISPDHFRALKTPFGVTTADLETATGVLFADRPFAQAVLTASDMFSDIGGAPREHGIHAITPFIRAVFPNARIVAITTATASTPAEWRAAAEIIGTLVTPRTLIVQSTDYSHFLPVETAALRDQETVSALASGDPEAVLSLIQPDHMDSRAAQFIQMTLQRKLYNSAPVIVANRNANEYIATPGPTTSYIVTVYTPEPEHGWQLHYPDQTITYFGGDTFIGRGWTDLALRPAAINWLEQRIRDFTGANPFLINLEGVVLDEQPAGANYVQHLMLSKLVLPVLKRLGVSAVNSANNHAYDFGPEGLAESTRLLETNGIQVVRHGVVAQYGQVNLLPLTFKRSYFYDHSVIRSPSQLEAICTMQASSPLIVLAHWGVDYADKPGSFEKEALATLEKCGVAAVIGAHSHRASPNIERSASGALQSVFSMGNLIFDQTGTDISGALVEMRVFRQGTIALRVIQIPNFFEALRSPAFQ